MTMNKPCVMLALSSRQLALSMQKSLEGTARAVPCCSEEDVRSFLRTQHPDVVIVDAPGDGGALSQIQRLRDKTEGAPLVLLSDGIMPKAADAEYLEADDVLERPFSDFRLRTCVVTQTRLHLSLIHI